MRFVFGHSGFHGLASANSSMRFLSVMLPFNKLLP